VVSALPLLHVVGTTPGRAPQEALDRVLPSGREGAITSLIVGDGEGPLEVTGIEVHPDRIEAHVAPSATLVLRQPDAGADPLVQSASFDISFEGPESQRDDALIHARRIAERDIVDLWNVRRPEPGAAAATSSKSRAVGPSSSVRGTDGSAVVRRRSRGPPRCRGDRRA
jgi:hypothetical protein